MWAQKRGLTPQIIREHRESAIRTLVKAIFQAPQPNAFKNSVFEASTKTRLKYYYRWQGNIGPSLKSAAGRDRFLGTWQPRRNQEKCSVLSACELRSFVVVLCLRKFWFPSWIFAPFLVWSPPGWGPPIVVWKFLFVAGKFGFVVLRMGSGCGQTTFRSLAEHICSFENVDS